MGVTLTKELVRVDQVVGEAKTQTIVEGTLTVPNGKPDIERIISVDAILNTDSLETNILDAHIGKVIVEGNINVNVMYVGRVAQQTQPVHFFEDDVKFSFFVKIPGITKDMDVRVRARIEHIQFDFDPNNPREMKVRIIVQFIVKVTQRVEIEIVIDATGPADLQVLRRTLRIEDVIGEARAQNIVKSDLTVPDVKPAIEEIIKVDGRVVDSETQMKIIDNKIIIEGVLEVGILYVADVPEGQLQQPVHFFEGRIPFTQFVEIPGAREGMSKLVRVEVEHIRGRRKDDRTVGIDAILKIRAKVFETKVLQVIIDVFSPSEELEVIKRHLRVDQVIGHDENEIVVKDTLDVPTPKPDIEQIYRVNCRAVVREARIIDGKVIVEGDLIIEVLYVADVPEGQPQQPLHFVERRVEFTTFVEIPGATDDMMLDFEVLVEHCSASVVPNNPRRFDVRAVLALIAKVTETVELDIVVDVIEPEEEEEEEEEEKKEEKKEEKGEQKPSMTIYIVQRGDTLWKIAKRYNVTIDSIVRANNIANPDSIVPGQQLVIPRNM